MTQKKTTALLKLCGSVFILASVLGSQEASAFPEFVRHGYFSCTSCHVSPGGGGILTDYGRSYSAEKLSASAAKGEEEALHGMLGGEPGKGIRSWLLVGGNIRQVQTMSENKNSRDGRWIPMQRDLEMCLTGGTLTTCVTGGITRHGLRSPDGKTEYGVRKAVVQLQAGESWLVRTGRFSPRFGVMIPDHNAWIQSLSGRGIDDERDQVEAIYSAEKIEAGISIDRGRVGDPDLATGYIANAMTPLTEKIRAGGSYRIQESSDASIQTAGVFSALGIDEKTYVLLELDEQKLSPKGAADAKTLSRVASYLKAGRELTQGLVGYALQQTDFKEGKPNVARRDMYGLGLQYFPRPHFEIDAFAGKVLSRADFTYANTAWLLFHYYL